MTEPKPVAPLDETATLRDQLRALGGMVLTLAHHVEAINAEQATHAEALAAVEAPATGDVGILAQALEAERTARAHDIEDVRRAVEHIVAIIGD